MSGIVTKKTEMTWCPGCGNFGIHKMVLSALNDLAIPLEQLVFVSGIGQAAKSPHYYDVSYFNGLHGRALPPATGIKAANPDLKVVVESGDGDMYGEGGNHFIHSIRRNPDITVIVHDNMVYGLTKGQASPTSQIGMRTPVQIDGVFETPLNPIALAVSLGAAFVARGSAGEPDLTKDIIKQAVSWKGFALIDIFQACVSFNKLNTHQWFKENTKPLPADHDPGDREKAFHTALQEKPWYLGVFYRDSSKPLFEEKLAPYISGDRTPLFRRLRSPGLARELLEEKK